MKRLVSLALASASLAAITAVTSPASAQTARPAAAPAEEATLGEIVVTARRRSESLQEVPQTVSAVTSDTLQKLNITQFQDVQTVVPGLSLAQNGSGYQAAASLRGVTFDVNTGAEPTVAMYLNDAPVQSLFLFSSLFDIGQVEVLRGPQGTTRGVSAPSGAITVSTHKPDLSEFGGYLDGTLSDQQGRNAQGAINVPIIKDVLAVRLAGLIDQNQFNGVRSIHDPLRPRQTTSSERLGVSFEPSDVFNANVTYSHLDKKLNAFNQVSGPGQGTFRDPPIAPDQYASVEDGISDIRTNLDVVTAQVDSRIFGQHLSYVGSYQFQKIRSKELNDSGDIVPGAEFYGRTRSTQEQTTHEIRLASDPAPGRFFDYTVGAYLGWRNIAGHVDRQGPLLPGAFGPGLGVDLAQFNPAYQVPLTIDVPSTQQETSLFGSVTLHLGSQTELSGGIRHIWSIVNNSTLLQTQNGLLNVGLPCSLLGLSPGGSAPNDCAVPAASVIADLHNRTSETPNIYNVSLSHHFSRDFLAYVNTGTSFRPPVASVGIFGALASSTDPVLRSLTFHPSETSRAYEVGFKWTFLDGRGRLNASAFRQRFHNLTIFVPNIQYLNTSQNAVSNLGATASVDALVQGFDLDTAFQITPDWNISAQMSYADAKVEGSQVPCNTFVNGRPVFNAVDPASGLAVISLCPGGAASRLPLWNATLQTEYTHPVADGMDGFVRGLLTYYPENKNRAEADFTVDAYSLMNLYAGVRSHDGAWEVSLFARNALRTRRLLDRAPAANDANTPLGQFYSQLIPAGGSGYFATTMTPEREVGVHVRYAWGSR